MPGLGVTILFGSQKGRAKSVAYDLAAYCREMLGDTTVDVVDLSTMDFDQMLSAFDGYYLFVVSSYTNGTAPPACSEWFSELRAHVRMAQNGPSAESLKTALAGSRHAVFGLGDSAYGKSFNVAAKTLSTDLALLGSQEIAPPGLGDGGASATTTVDVNDVNDPLGATFRRWRRKIVALVRSGLKSDREAHGEDVQGLDNGYVSDLTDEEVPAVSTNGAIVDLEDALLTAPAQLQQRGARRGQNRGMLTAPLRGALGRQGYQLVGTHSAIKMCRWTKSMLRGRGGCYKYTFYGIRSHRCMEATPSLACANKCVFCWRHHTNPVTTDWRWAVDPAEEVVAGMVQAHRSLVKQFRGVPGVVPDRLAEGMEPRHCALSLVGEPVIYPQIRQLINDLHRRKISSFLVTNGQFPDAIRALPPLTQFYLSVDAPNAESMKAVDQPLFEDFWERFLASIDALRDRKQRTVYRMTLVRGWNMADLEGYASLIRRGSPDFVEIKGVTYCGSFATPVKGDGVTAAVPAVTADDDESVAPGAVGAACGGGTGDATCGCKATGTAPATGCCSAPPAVDSRVAPSEAPTDRTAQPPPAGPDGLLRDRRGRPRPQASAPGASTVTMANVPTHEEVLDFSRQLAMAVAGDDYEVVCEHEHSCCVVLAHKRFCFDGIWNTHIDFEKFTSQATANTDAEAAGKPLPYEITSSSYAAETPTWALVGSPERGFAPEQVRHYRRGAGTTEAASTVAPGDEEA